MDPLDGWMMIDFINELRRRPAAFTSLILPVSFPERVVHELLDELSPPQGTCQRQVALYCPFQVINKFVGPKPPQLSLRLCIFCGPADTTAEHFKIPPAAVPYVPLNAVSKLAPAVAQPQLLHGTQICVGNLSRKRCADQNRLGGKRLRGGQ
jgi:hypothetical protein